MRKEYFYIITMKTKENTKLYLAADIGNSCKWLFDKNESIWFETYQDAEKFSNQYFKNFNKYTIEEISIMI